MGRGSLDPERGNVNDCALDRFDLFFWRLRQSGLTIRRKPRAPFTTKPLRWPDRL